MNYRKFYSEQLDGLIWDKKRFHIHHIDCNHNNNDFDNLVLIPSKLHNQFHFSYNALKSTGNIQDILSEKIIYVDDFTTRMITLLLQTKRQIADFIDIKDTLTGQKLLEKDFEKLISILLCGYKRTLK
jgi:hypothetical protein